MAKKKQQNEVKTETPSFFDGMIELCFFVPVSKLYDKLTDWMREEISEEVNMSSSFTFGDNNRSLITTERFLAQIEHLDWFQTEEGKKWADEIRSGSIGNLYIDLEN